MSALTFLMRYGRETLIVALALGVFAACEARDHALQARGVALERARIADSLLTVSATQLARVDTVYRRDTVRLMRTVARLDTLRDTVLARLTDTLVVKQFVQASDSAARVCRDVANDCARIKQLYAERLRVDSLKFRVSPSIAKRQHLGLGATCGAVASSSTPTLGGGCAVGLTFRW